MPLRIALLAMFCAVLACDDDDNDEHSHPRDARHTHDASATEDPSDAAIDAAPSDSQPARPDADAPPPAKDGKKLYAVRFDIRAGGAPFRCGSHASVGTQGTRIEPVDLRFFVHDVALIRAKGERVPLELYQDERWQRENVALLDFVDDTGMCETGDTATRDVVYGYADEHDDYTSVAFDLGVPADKNHLDAARAPAPYNASGLWWSWSLGYKYTRIDVSSVEQPIWFFHLGAAGCSGTVADGFNCDARHIPHIELPDYNPSTSIVVYDLDEFYAKSDLTQGDDTPGCMSFKGDSQCQPLFDTLGIIAWDDNAKTKPKQTAFVLASGAPFREPNAGGKTQVAEVNDPTAWPNIDYERPTALDVANVSKRGEKRSHGQDDPRYNVNCMRCHQEFGPGIGRFAAAGTVVDTTGKPASFARVEIFTGTPMGTTIADFVSRAMLDVDDNGNFFTTRELPPNRDYGARILDGSDKVLIQMPFTQPTTACNNCHTGRMHLTVPAPK